MASVAELDEMVRTAKENGCEDLTLLKCTSSYPATPEGTNLRTIPHMKELFKCNVGLSDHTLGIGAAVASIALGATVIEKHFTLDRNMEGPDHKASLEPDELKAMVSAIRNIEKAVGGDGTKHISNSERKNIAIARKSIVAAKDIKKGELLTEENLTVKRPGTGISPMRWEEVVGTKAIKDFSEEDLIEI